MLAKDILWDLYPVRSGNYYSILCYFYLNHGICYIAYGSTKCQCLIKMEILKI